MFQKYSNIIIGCLLVFAIYESNAWLHYSIDLTAEKRYSLSEATKKLLDKKLDSAITVEVFLSGDLPADYKKLNIIDEIITEPLGGAHRDYDKISLSIKESLIKNLSILNRMSKEELLDRRYKRLVEIGI